MKLKIKEFAEEVGFVKSASEKMATIPVLSYMLVKKVSENKAEIITTDLDRTLRTIVEVEGITESFTLPVRKIADIISKLQEPVLDLQIEDNYWLKLKNGRAVFRLPGVDSTSFPEVPELGEEKVRIAAGLLNMLIKNTSYAITEEQSRFTLSGAKFLAVDGSFRMIATDGHRMAMVSSNDYEDKAGLNDQKVTFDVLIPKKAILDLQKMTNDCSAETEVIISESASGLSFKVGERLLQCRKLAGNFPNYQMVIPKNGNTIVKVETQTTFDVLKRVALMADSRTKLAKLKLGNDELNISSISSEEGEASESIPCEGITGLDNISTGFNSGYLADVFRIAENIQQNLSDRTETTENGTVRQIKADRTLNFEINSNSPDEQWLIRPGGLEELNLSGAHIIMPCRL